MSVKNFTNGIKGMSSSLRYIIEDNLFYWLPSLSGTYQQISTFGIWDTFKIKERNDNLVIAMSNGTWNSTMGYYMIHQSTYVLSNRNGTVSLHNAFNVSNGISYNMMEVPVETSPSLEKVLFKYRTYGATDPVLVVKEVDYVSGLTKDLFFDDKPHFLNTIRNMGAFNETNFFLGDKYMTVRNETYMSNYQLTVQEAYEFEENDTIKWLGFKVLGSDERNVTILTWVGEKMDGEVEIFDVYHRSVTGNEVYQVVTFNEACVYKADGNNSFNGSMPGYNMSYPSGSYPMNFSYSFPYNNTNASQCYHVLTEIPFDSSDHVEGSEEFEAIKTSHVSGNTEISLTVFNKTARTPTTWYLNQSGLWSYLSRSPETLSCTLFTDSVGQFKLFQFSPENQTFSEYKSFNALAIPPSVNMSQVRIG